MQRLTFAFFPEYLSKNNIIALEIRILVSAPGEETTHQNTDTHRSPKDTQSRPRKELLQAMSLQSHAWKRDNAFS